MTFSVTLPGLHQPQAGLVLGQLVVLRVKAEDGALREAWGWGGIGVTRMSQPWKGAKRLKLSWAPVAPTWNSSIWVVEQGDSWKSEANLGYTV